MQIALSLIRVDGGTQPRAAINADAVEAYADAMKSGAIFPPVDVYYDGADYWLADGFHRVRATVSICAVEIDCNVLQGTLEDAQWHSIGANQLNGLYRSNADKQRAIEAALRHPKSQGLSDREIGRHVGVDHKTIAAAKEKLTGEIPQSNMRTGKDGRTINTENIGKRAQWAAKREEVVAAMKTNPSVANAELAEVFSVSESAVGEWRRAEGIEKPSTSPRIPENPTGKNALRVKAQIGRLMVGLNQIVGASSTLTALHLPAISKGLSGEQKDQVRVLIRRARKDIGIIASALEDRNVSSSETDQLSDDAA